MKRNKKPATMRRRAYVCAEYFDMKSSDPRLTTTTHPCRGLLRANSLQGALAMTRGDDPSFGHASSCERPVIRPPSSRATVVRPRVVIASDKSFLRGAKRSSSHHHDPSVPRIASGELPTRRLAMTEALTFTVVRETSRSGRDCRASPPVVALQTAWLRRG